MYRKNIALVAHDNKKQSLLACVHNHYHTLKDHNLICTGTTGQLVEETIQKIHEGRGPMPSVHKLKSGPLGGDQQLGAMIAEARVDMMIFLWDPMEPQPHDVDIKALLRLAVLYNIPTASSRATADFLLTSPLLNSDYQPDAPDFEDYLHRDINKKDTGF